MRYELAKELKDAGYLMPNTTVWDNRLYKEDIVITESIRASLWLPILMSPTLSELIEACALKTLRLESWKEGWKAGDYLHQSMKKYALGKTPEEAVANLWLRLNDKEALDKTPPNKV